MYTMTKTMNKKAVVEAIISRIMEDWNCTELEAEASLALDTETLDSTIKAIRRAVTYDRLTKSLPYAKAEYLKNELYKDEPIADDEEFIQSEAKELAEGEAYMFVYDWEQLDDYEDMTEEEIKRVLFAVDTN